MAEFDIDAICIELLALADLFFKYIIDGF